MDITFPHPLLMHLMMGPRAFESLARISSVRPHFWHAHPAILSPVRNGGHAAYRVGHAGLVSVVAVSATLVVGGWVYHPGLWLSLHREDPGSLEGE